MRETEGKLACTQGELTNQHCKNQNGRESRGLASSIDEHETLRERKRHQRFISKKKRKGTREERGRRTYFLLERRGPSEGPAAG